MKHKHYLSFISIFFTIILLSSSLVMASLPEEGILLEGDDTEERLEYARDNFFDDVAFDLSDFTASDNSLGSDHMGDFEYARDFYEEFSKKKNGLIEALSLMFSEYSINLNARTGINRSLLDPLETNDEDFMHFHRGMNWKTIRLKLSGFPRACETLEKQFAIAHVKHIEFKTDDFQRRYSRLVKGIKKVTSDFARIDEVYGEPQTVPEVEDVRRFELDDLKIALPDLKTAAAAYKDELENAKLWQRDLNALRKKYDVFAREYVKISAAFEVLRQKNEDNTELPEGGLGGLDDISEEGNLETLQGIIGDLEGELRTYRAMLAKARRWKPPLVEDEEEGEDDGF